MHSRNALAKNVALAEQYRIDSVLGAGGFGVTYMAIDTGLGSEVVLKEYFPAQSAIRDEAGAVHPRSDRDEAIYQWGRERFVREARILDSCRHAHIVRVRRVFEANNTAYMALDFENGPSLEAWLGRLGRAPTQGELDAILWGLLDALDYLHNRPQPVIHRDIAPDNIIMRDGNHPVLIDFGAARVETAGRAESRVGAVKDGYSPREQYSQRGDLQGPWTDIYSLAATIRRAITGERPPDSMGRDLDDNMVPLQQLATAGYRPQFLAGIDYAMNVRHTDRPQTVGEWREMLFEGLEEGRPESDAMPAVQGSGPRPSSRPRPSRPGAARTQSRQTAAVQSKVAAPAPAAAELVATPLFSAPPLAPPRTSMAGRILLLGVGLVVVLGMGMAVAQLLGVVQERVAVRVDPPADTTPKAPSTSTSPSPSPSSAPSPQSKPAATVDAAALIAECTRLAGAPAKGQAGVAFEDIKAEEAMRACDAAVRATPGNTRMEALLGRALVRAGNYGAARQWLERAAAAGEAIAMFHLGALYADGHGVVRDYSKAREWYEKAVQQDEPYALTSLAILYELGRGVAVDNGKARELLEKAAAIGHAPAMRSLGLLYENGRGVPVDYAKAREWLEAAAAAGNGEALTNLGLIYANGRGVTQDFEKAVAFYKLGADRNIPSALNNLGYSYETGRGVKQDLAEAARLFQLSADRGFSLAQSNLGYLYESGRGVTQDYAKARELYEKAALAGFNRAMSRLGLLYENGRGVAVDLPLARKWLERGSERGDSLGQYHLARFLDQARGGAADYAKAAQQLLLAARGGSAEATSVLGGFLPRWNAETVKALQTQLKASGQYTGDVNGRWDAAGQAAAKQFIEARRT